MTAPMQMAPSPVGGGPVAFQDREELLADIGDRIRAERHARGWAGTALAAKTGVSRRTVERVETGKSPLPLSLFAALCEALGVSMSLLLSDQWVMPARFRRAVLTPRQTEILLLASSGLTLQQVGVRVGTTRQAVASRLSETYRLLGVSDLPPDERRAAAAQIAEDRGLFAATSESHAA
ncbi:helix-turn-helix domain-containing protein [Streptomyces sp. NPDC056192]|uniref:helix-turn-helix domain-containing protein n=1 Tax=Streptomyces sp. NPDC056192 TaxID=3345743 RepID=UPI0035DC262C